KHSTNQSSIQTVTVLNADGGTFTLSFGGKTTGDLAFNADPNSGTGNVQDALNNLDSIKNVSGSVTVTRNTVPHGYEYVITFGGSLANKPVDEIIVDAGEKTVGDKLTNSTASALFSSGNITAVTANSTHGNDSLAALPGQVQDAIDAALISKGFGLGFFHTGDTSNNNAPITNASPFIATGKYATTLPSDIPLSIDLPHQAFVTQTQA